MNRTTYIYGKRATGNSNTEDKTGDTIESFNNNKLGTNNVLTIKTDMGTHTAKVVVDVNKEYVDAEDNNLQAQIDSLILSITSDHVALTNAEMQTIVAKDGETCIVLIDETQENKEAVYKYETSVWVLKGTRDSTYTKSEIDIIVDNFNNQQTVQDDRLTALENAPKNTLDKPKSTYNNTTNVLTVTMTDGVTHDFPLDDLSNWDIVQKDTGRAFAGSKFNNDMNLLTEPRRYFIGNVGVLNKPIDEVGFVDAICRDNNNDNIQLFISLYSHRAFVRSKVDNIWTDWDELSITLDTINTKLDGNLLTIMMTDGTKAEIDLTPALPDIDENIYLRKDGITVDANNKVQTLVFTGDKYMSLEAANGDFIMMQELTSVTDGFAQFKFGETNSAYDTGMSALVWEGDQPYTVFKADLTKYNEPQSTPVLDTDIHYVGTTLATDYNKLGLGDFITKHVFDEKLKELSTLSHNGETQQNHKLTNDDGTQRQHPQALSVGGNGDLVDFGLESGFYKSNMNLFNKNRPFNTDGTEIKYGSIHISVEDFAENDNISAMYMLKIYDILKAPRVFYASSTTGTFSGWREVGYVDAPTQRETELETKVTELETRLLKLEEKL